MKLSQTFSEILATLESSDHIQSITLLNEDGSVAGIIENKPGSAGSVRVYHHLFKKWGVINVDAANEGLQIYAEHTEDAKLNTGKHPNIDRLFAVIASGKPFAVKVIAK